MTDYTREALREIEPTIMEKWSTYLKNGFNQGDSVSFLSDLLHNRADEIGEHIVTIKNA